MYIVVKNKLGTIEKILSSGTRAAIFTTLFGIDQKELHLREIQRKSGYSVEAVRKELNSLSELGLILKKRDGNRLYFKANVNHPLFIDLRSMVLKTSGLKAVLEKALNIESIKFAFVFGSIAKSGETANSDIDLFVIGNLGLRDLSKLLKDPADTFGREINPHVMSENDFLSRKKSEEHFILNILNSPILMIIGSEDEFRRLA